MPLLAAAAPAARPAARRRLAAVAAAAVAVVGALGSASPADAAALGSSTSYRVSTVQNPVLDRPEVIRWDPCTTIGYRVNAALGGRRAGADAKAAVDRLAATSGLRFRYLGSTSFVPSAGRRLPAGTQLVIAFARPGSGAGRTSLLGPGEVGRGGWSATTSASGRFRISSGYVVVKAGAPLATGFGAGVTRGRVLMHELGHAVGLDHVSNVREVMNTTVQPQSPAARFGAGDVTGLRRVGSPAGCIR